MSKNLVSALEKNANLTLTENGAATYKSTLNLVYDLFARGGAMREATVEQRIDLFSTAYRSDPLLALKCLFYLRNPREGLGERQIFRDALRWLAIEYPHEAIHLIPYIAKYGRWDDLYVFYQTDAENDMWRCMKNQFDEDMHTETPSLLGKWLKSCNASSPQTRILGEATRHAFGLSERQYRKALSMLRRKINIIETIMSENRQYDIKYDKLPSRAGFIYRNAFKKHDYGGYMDFIENKRTKVKTSVLYPYDAVHAVVKTLTEENLINKFIMTRYQEQEYLQWRHKNKDEITILNKYWDNMQDYFQNATLDALIVCDTSASMTNAENSVAPIDVAISLALYAAEHNNGVWKNKYISFSRHPQLIHVQGNDFVDKVQNIGRINLCENTNIEATFDLLLHTMQRYHLTQEDLPKNLIIISDMQFDEGIYTPHSKDLNVSTLMENIHQKWCDAGYIMPHLIYWNVNGKYTGAIPDRSQNISYVSGSSPILFSAIMANKTGIEMMTDILSAPWLQEITSIYKKDDA